VRRRIWIFVGKYSVIPLSRIVGIGVGFTVWPSIEVMKGISLFNSEVLGQLVDMALTAIVPVNIEHFTNTHLTFQPIRSTSL